MTVGRVAGDDRPATMPAKIAAALDRLGRVQRLGRQATATRLGLTPLQIDLLATLAGGPPPAPTVGQLATEVNVSQPTATDSLRALLDKGLIERLPHGTDRRSSTVALTDAGRTIAASLPQGHDVADVVADMDQSHQETLLATLLDVIAALVQRGVIDTARTCTTCSHHRRRGDIDHCALLGVDLARSQLRVNCPDHRAA